MSKEVDWICDQSDNIARAFLEAKASGTIDEMWADWDGITDIYESNPKICHYGRHCKYAECKIKKVLEHKKDLYKSIT